MDVTNLKQNLQEKITLNSLTAADCFEFKVGTIFLCFAFSGVRRPLSGVRCPASAVRHAWFLVISRKSIYPIFTKFGMGVYWVNSLHGIAFGEDSSIANSVIAT